MTRNPYLDANQLAPQCGMTAVDWIAGELEDIRSCIAVAQRHGDAVGLADLREQERDAAEALREFCVSGDRMAGT